MEHPDSGIDVNNGKPVKRSTGLFGWSTIYGRAGEHDTPYMTRIWLGRLRLHIFYRGDADPDCHDHPWDFWTFPLTSYVEEVDTALVNPDGSNIRIRQVVPGWCLSFRAAEHGHRFLGRATDQAEGFAHYKTGVINPEFERFIQLTEPGKVITIVWRGKERRKWGFLKHRDGRWCWVHWKEYVFGGGKDAPCS